MYMLNVLIYYRKNEKKIPANHHIELIKLAKSLEQINLRNNVFISIIKKNGFALIRHNGVGFVAKSSVMNKWNLFG